MHLGPVAEAFGHGGAGGSCHRAWPEQGIGFSYAMNQLRDDNDVDPRSQSLLDATHRAITA
jgi:CubicO group peptidase (beta-lactamase class C family)